MGLVSVMTNRVHRAACQAVREWLQCDWSVFKTHDVIFFQFCSLMWVAWASAFLVAVKNCVQCRYDCFTSDIFDNVRQLLQGFGGDFPWSPSSGGVCGKQSQALGTQGPASQSAQQFSTDHERAGNHRARGRRCNGGDDGHRTTQWAVKLKEKSFPRKIFCTL